MGQILAVFAGVADHREGVVIIHFICSLTAPSIGTRGRWSLLRLGMTLRQICQVSRFSIQICYALNLLSGTVLVAHGFVFTQVGDSSLSGSLENLETLLCGA